MTVVAAVQDFQRPGSVEVEQAMLGAALIHTGAMSAARDLLVDDDFGEAIHRTIWAALCEAADSGIATPALVIARMGSISAADLGGVSLAQYVARLAAEATSVSNTRSYCEAIRDNADRRRLSEVFLGLPASLAGDVPVQAIAAHLMAACDAVASRRTGKGNRRVTIEQAMVEAIDQASEAYRRNGEPIGVPMGINALDHALGGLQRGALHLLMARPSMGKTALAVETARNAAAAGHPVLIFSLEMVAPSLATRLASALCYQPGHSVPFFNVEKGRIDEDQFGLFVDAARQGSRLPIVIEPQSHIMAAQIAARARRWANENIGAGSKDGLIIIDYLGLVRSSDRYAGQRNNEVTEISAALKGIAKELNLPVLCLAQMSRNAEHRDDKRPQLSDLRDSGSLEQDADVVMGLYRPAYYLSRKANKSPEDEARLAADLNLLEVSVLKQRQGPTGIYRVFYAAESNYVGDLERSRL